MQNQFVFSAGKSFVGHFVSGGIVKGLGLPHQKNALPRLKNDLQSRNFTENRGNAPVVLLGGGLGKLQGSFKEELYFNINEHALMAKLQETGYRLKCESSTNSNWKEFERMANDLTRPTAGQLCKHKNCPEESFFLQEQRSLLERILDALRRLFPNRSGGMPMPPPYGGGLYPYGPQYYHSRDEKKTEENNENDKNKDDEEANKATNEDEKNNEPSEDSEENKTPENNIPEEPQSFPEENDGRGDGQGGEGRE